VVVSDCLKLTGLFRRLLFYVCLVGGVLASSVVGNLAFAATASAADINAIDQAEPSDIDALRQKIAARQASMADIKQALSTGGPGDIANAMHALYAMRASSMARSLMFDIWRNLQQEHPDLHWETLQLPVIRVALASTMNRIAAGTIPEFLDYIRSQSDSEESLVRAQVAMALGLNGDVQDIDLLVGGAAGDDHYVAQSAITGLAFMYIPQARDRLIELSGKYDNTPRGRLINEMLQSAYGWTPPQSAAVPPE